jgi:hypothetical protein
MKALLDFRPRGLPISTGEYLPGGANSLFGRMLVFELHEGDVEEAAVIARQDLGATGAYAQAMGSFIQWVAAHRDELREIKHESFHAYREDARSAGVHVRTPGIIADLRLAWQAFLAFALESKAITEDEMDQLFEAGINVLHEAGQAQAQFQLAQDQVALYFHCIRQAILSGRAHLASRQNPNKPPRAGMSIVLEDYTDNGWSRRDVGSGRYARTDIKPKGMLIGYRDDGEEDLYLLPIPTYKVVQQNAPNQSFTISPLELKRRLFNEGYMPQAERDREVYTDRVTVGRESTPVLHLKASVLGFVDPNEPALTPGAEPDDDEA